MDIRQLQALIMVADTKSFKKASKNLYISQSQTSKLIAALEKEVDYKLLIRKKEVELTEEGERIYRNAIEMLRSYENMAIKNAEKKTLKLSVAASANVNMGGIFAEYVGLGSTDNYTYKFKERSVFDIAGDLHTKKTVMAFTCVEESDRTAFEMRLKNFSLSYYPIKEVKPYAIMNKNHYLTHNQSVDIEGIIDFRIAQIDGGIFAPLANPGYVHDRKRLFDYDFVDMTSSNLYSLLEVVASSELVYLGVDVFNNINFPKNLILKKLNDNCGGVTFGYVKRENLVLDSQYEDFIRFVKWKLSKCK